MAVRRNKESENYKEFEFSGGHIRIYEGQKNDYGTLSLDCGFAIRIRVIKTDDAVFISYPSYKDDDGNYINQAYCFDKDVIKELDEILAKIY